MAIHIKISVEYGTTNPTRWATVSRAVAATNYAETSFCLVSRVYTRLQYRDRNVADILRRDASPCLVARLCASGVQQFDFEFSFHIYSVIVFCMPAVNFGLTILTHHDDGRCVGGLER